MTSFLALHGATLIANGFPIIPIKPSDKAPGKWDGIAGGWVDLRGWQQFCERTPTDIELSAWESWPDAGAGIPCGMVVGIDIDVMDPALSQQLGEFTRQQLGDTPLIRFGQRPKRLMVYRAVTPFASFDVLAGDAANRLGKKPLQVLATGRQFVAHGIHPVTGAPYEWPEENPAGVVFEDLPAVSANQVRAWATGAARILGIEWPPAGHGERSTSDKELATRAAIEQALSFVPVDSCRSREDWLAVGMAIHSGLGGDGVELWDAWSAGSNQAKADGSSVYDAKALQAQWNGFHRSGPGAIGPGTLFDRARSFGWRPDGVFLYQHEADAAAAAPSIDFDALIAAIDARNGVAGLDAEPDVPAAEPEPTWTVPPGLPGWLRDLTGGLRMFVDHAADTAHSPQPWIALGGALAMFGAVAGRRYAGPTRLRTNLYTIGIGESGSGKNHPLSMTGQLLAEAGLHRLIGGEKIASGAGMLSALEQQPSILFAIDEIGFLFRAASAARAPKHVTEILENMTAFYSNADRTFRGTEYGDKKVKARQPIEQPCMNIYGLTTPRVFWSALNSVHVEDGTLARIMIFETDCNYPEMRDVVPRPFSDDLINHVRWTGEGAEGHNTFPIGEVSNTAPNPFSVPYGSPAAYELAQEMTRYQRQLKIEHEGTVLSAVMARVVENAFKVALVRAVANNPALPAIDTADLHWSYDIAWQSADALAKAVRERVGDNEGERDLKRVLKIINDAGSGGIDGNLLSRRTQFVKGRDRKQIIDDLIEAHQVRVEQQMTGGRPRVIYYGQ
ncbi:PriCT-2 domain-containing protein [Sphingomonas sp. ac-8]|uniref:PriCT-2 domain-containing protein n=1 Tax=Sphingomonas sp. ac-8 TaxID=3242977 RepID=UPI003A7FE6F2